MTDKDYKVLQYRVSGLTPSEIAEIDGRSIARIKAIVYTSTFKQLVDDGKRERDSRINQSPSDRMADIVGKALLALEKQVDDCAGDPTKVITLIPKMVELGKVVQPTKGKLSELGVVVLPELEDEKSFNSRTLAGNPTQPHPRTPNGTEISPGGSKTPAPTHNIESIEPPAMESPEQERTWEEIEKEVREAAGGW